MKHCTICWQACKEWAKYCGKCWRLLVRNRTLASNLSKRFWSKLCPICFTPINKHEWFCKDCLSTMNTRKQILYISVKPMADEYLTLEYTYIIKDPKFFRKNRKDHVTYKVIELWLRTWYIFTQNLEILYKEWLPKRNRFQWKEKYFEEYIVPIIRKQYERWRLNAIWFWVDVAVETILQWWKTFNSNEDTWKQK